MTTFRLYSTYLNGGSFIDVRNRLVPLKIATSCRVVRDHRKRALTCCKLEASLSSLP